MNLKTALEHGAARLAHLVNARRDAELLLLGVTGRDRAFSLTHPDDVLTAAQQSTYDAWLARRSRHEPIQYILGEQEFYGLVFNVTPDVLIPRPETEHLIEAALERVAHDAAPRIADVGTGSGAIAVALACTLPRARITALDCSVCALAVAKGNAERHGVSGRIQFLQSDLLSPHVSEARHGAPAPGWGAGFDLIVSNPPYVPENEELETQVCDYEPHVALFAGPSGLEIYRRLIPQAWNALESGGWLLMEMGHGQRDALAGLLTGWADVAFINDLQGIQRVACARKP